MDSDRYSTLFESEAKEILQSFEDGVMALEKEPKSAEVIDELFRLVHTLKGMAGMMNFSEISAVSHALENIFDSLKAGAIEAPTIIDLLLEIGDGLSKMVKGAISGEDFEVDPGELIAKTEAIIKGAKTKRGKDAKTPTKKKKCVNKKMEDEVEIGIEKIESVRISSERLNRWTDLLGELLILKTMFQDIAQTYRSEALDEAVSNLDKNLTGIRDDLLAARLVPTGLIFNRFPRMVREMAKTEGKEINLAIEGGDIELDKLILDRISEPLVHLIKNAVAHGIEKPKDREKVGKDSSGKIILSAERLENRVVIRVEDDGGGVDPAEIRKMAIREGFINEDEPQDDEGSIDLLFSPGFTTAEKATESSGRGVGLDSVRQLAKSMNGSCDFESKKGKGAVVTLSLPLTTAIIQALIVKVANRHYALPLNEVLETLQVKPDDIKVVGGKSSILLRDEIVPLIRLVDVFGLPHKGEDFPLVVVVKRGNDLFGLIVDSILTKQEILVKPLDPLFRDLSWISGSTILGDGSVALILDINGLLVEANT